MNNSTTIDLDFLVRKSLYIQHLFSKLPKSKIKEKFPAPRKEFLDKMKSTLHNHYNQIPDKPQQ